MKKLLSLFTALVLCTAMWGANVINPGTYSGKWKLNVISNFAGRTIASSNIVVEAEMDGKQTITFNNFKLPHTSALETTIQLILSTSDKKITVASQQTGYKNGDYPVSIVTYDNYKSASLYNPSTGVLTFGVKYVYTNNSTTYTYGNAFEYIELQLNDKWSEWVAFPSEEKNTAHWTINDETNPYWKDSIKTKVPTPEVKLYVRTSKTDNAVKQIKVENFNLGIKDAKNADVILDWDCSTNSISVTDQVLNFNYTYKSDNKTYVNFAKVKTDENALGSINIKTGELTLPLQYLKEGFRHQVSETLQLQDYEMPYSDWEDFSPLGLSKGNYYVSANKNTWHENLNIQVRECTLDAQYKQIKVQDWNYSDIASCKMDLIIDWNSKTNKCTIAQKSTGYAINGKTIYIKTRKDTEGTYSDGVFVFPILYATTEKTISNTTDDTLRMQKPVKSITFDNKEYTLASVEDNKIITPTVTPDDATNKSVTYTSSNSDVATVDNGENAGKIHFISAGETTITATANDGSGVSGSYKLTTFVRVTDITLDQTSVDLSPNSEVTLTATVEPSNATTQTVKWTSNDEDVVKVNENGKLQFVDIGSAIITASATDDSNISSSCEVSTYRISLANPGYGTEYIVPVKGGKAYFKDVPSRSQLQFVLEGKDYAINDWKISRTNLSWITPSIGFDEQSNKVLFSFSAADSTLTPRAGSFSVEAYDYKFDGYTISQAAPTLTPRTGMENTKTFTFLGAGDDDALRIDGNKTEKIYLDSEVDLSDDNITVESKNGLTKIVKEYKSTSIGLTLTRDHLIAEEAEDIVIVSFKGNSGIKYEYTITQASMPSAYYEVPAGAFFAGMTDNSGQADPTFYVPYRHYETNPHQFSSKEAGTWKTDQGESSSKTSLSCANEMLKTCTTPQLIQDGKISFQYGATSNEYNSDLTFYVGDSVMRYMTPARLWTDLNTNPTGYQEGYGDGYKTTASQKMGVYFNNIDTMYIDGISIPISAGSTEAAKQKTETNLFGTSGSVTVNIYHATIEGDNKEKVDVENPIWTGTLTKDDFTPLSETEHYRGALNATFTDSISITGPFVVELSDMSGCDFYVLSDKSNGKNKWGYYVQSGTTTYPKNYCLAVSVHGMFPALYPKDDESLTIDDIPAEGVSKDKGGRPIRTIYANGEYITKGANGWSFSITEKSGISVVNNYKTKTSTPWYFTMTENTTTTEREGDVTFTFRGKSLTYHVIQEAAPTTYTRDNLTAGEWGTICLPYAAASFSGAEMYSIAGKMEGDAGIYLDQVATMEAGKPYIFKATDNKIVVVYAAGGGYQKAKSANGLCGYIGESEESYITVPVDGNSYIVYDKALYLVDSEVTLVSNRAYIKYNKVGTPSPAPQVRRVAMPINGAPANMLQVSDTKQPVKILRDGHIVILRADKEYDILGQSK